MGVSVPLFVVFFALFAVCIGVLSVVQVTVGEKVTDGFLRSLLFGPTTLLELLLSKTPLFKCCSFPSESESCSGAANLDLVRASLTFRPRLFSFAI